MCVNICSRLSLFHRKQIEISWTHWFSCVLNTGYFKFNKGPTAFWQILSRYIMYEVLPRSPNLDPLLEEFCSHNDAPFKNIPKFNIDTFKWLFLFHCWYSMRAHARKQKRSYFYQIPYLIIKWIIILSTVSRHLLQDLHQAESFPAWPRRFSRFV